MVRTQIQLRDDQARALKKQAKIEGVSLAEVIRRCIDRSLQETPDRRAVLYAEAAKVVGKFRDRRRARDLAEAHDAYLDEDGD